MKELIYDLMIFSAVWLGVIYVGLAMQAPAPRFADPQPGQKPAESLCSCGPACECTGLGGEDDDDAKRRRRR